MDKVARIQFKNMKENSKGFEIVTLKHFLDSSNAEFIGKQFRTEYYNLIYVTQGKCTHEIDFVEYTIHAGELLVISSNRVHKYTDFENVEGYLIMFTEGFLCEYLSSHSTEVKDLFSETYLNPQLKALDLYATAFSKLLDVMYYTYTHLNHVISYDVVASTFRTFAQLVINAKLVEEISVKRDNEIFIQFTQLVEKHLNVEKTVEGYANMMHVSKKTVNLMTRRAIDVSAKQYIIQQLILKIQLKLCFEQVSINQIADDLGFAEPSNMTKFFKKYTEVSPSEFRRMNRNNDYNWIRSESMDLDSIRESIEEKVYHITSEIVVPLHKHEKLDEIFYCIKGSGFGVLEDEELKLNVGGSFIVPAGTMHALRSEDELYVISFLIPVSDGRF